MERGGPIRYVLKHSRDRCCLSGHQCCVIVSPGGARLRNQGGMPLLDACPFPSQRKLKMAALAELPHIYILHPDRMEIIAYYSIQSFRPACAAVLQNVRICIRTSVALTDQQL